MASDNRCAVSVVCRDTNVCNGSKQTIKNRGGRQLRITVAGQGCTNYHASC
uniref:Uncharacterized protein n=1 Tax=Hyaloperonospora arabidopsidis (strain Emoy2) TaxID=559515 RepID=M4C598_HYAAE